jgi:hypothetical protein
MSDETKTNPSRDFMGHTITLADDWRFTVTGPEFDKSRYDITFHSIADAKKEIESRVTDAAKVEAQNIRLDLHVYDDNGALLQVDRINRRTGNLNTVAGRECYPDVPWIGQALLRAKQARKAILEIEKAIEPFEIRVSRSYGKIEPEAYPNRVREFEAEHKRKREAALAIEAEPNKPGLSVVQ